MHPPAVRYMPSRAQNYSIHDASVIQVMVCLNQAVTSVVDLGVTAYWHYCIRECVKLWID